MNFETKSVVESFEKAMGKFNSTYFRHISDDGAGTIKIEFDYVRVSEGSDSSYFILAEFSKKNPLTPFYSLTLTCKYDYAPLRKKVFSIKGRKFTIDHSKRSVICECGFFDFSNRELKDCFDVFFMACEQEPFIIYSHGKPICERNSDAMKYNIRKLNREIPTEITPFEPIKEDSDVFVSQVPDPSKGVKDNRKDAISMLHESLPKETAEDEPVVIETPRVKGMIAPAVGKELKKHVYGQDTYIEQIAIHIQEHIRLGKTAPILVIGPSGSGKTFTVMSLFEHCKSMLPSDYGFVYEDVSGITEKGFTGAEVSDIFKSINQKGIKRGIVFLDEIDKILVPSSNSSGENVNIPIQTELMNYISGKKYKNIDTSNFFFILCGAFPSLYAKHKALKRSIGFQHSDSHIDLAEMTKESSDELELVPMESKDGTEMFSITCGDYTSDSVALRNDLVEFGAVPEFVGRIGTIVTLNMLDEDVHRTILETVTIPNKIKEVHDLCDIDICFDESAKDVIVKSAGKNPYGARIIKATVDDLVNSILYKAIDVASKRFKGSNVTITISHEDDKYRYYLSCQNRLGAS